MQIEEKITLYKDDVLAVHERLKNEKGGAEGKKEKISC